MSSLDFHAKPKQTTLEHACPPNKSNSNLGIIMAAGYFQAIKHPNNPDPKKKASYQLTQIFPSPIDITELC